MPEGEYIVNNGYAQYKVGGKYGTYKDGVFTPGTSEKVSSNANRAPIQRNTVKGANAGGTLTRDESVYDLRASAAAGGRIGGLWTPDTTNPLTGVVKHGINVKQNTPLDGSRSGAEKLAGLQGLPSYGRTIATRYTGDAAADALISKYGNAQGAQSPTYERRGEGAEGYATTTAGVKNNAQIETDAKAAAQSKIAKEYSSRNGGSDIRLEYSRDGEGNIIGVAGFTGTTGDQALDNIRFQRYAEQWRNPASAAQIDEKYAAQEEEAMRQAMGVNDPFLGRVDQEANEDIERGGVQQRNDIAGIGGISQDGESASESSLERVITIAAEQRDKEYERAQTSRDNEIARIDAERKVAEKKLAKRITEEQHREMQEKMSAGYIKSTGKGKDLMSSQALIKQIESDYQEELQENMDTIQTNYESNMRGIVANYDQALAGADDFYYQAQMDVENAKMAQTDKMEERYYEAQKDLMDNDISWTDTVKEIRASVGNDPESIESSRPFILQSLAQVGVIGEAATNIVDGLIRDALKEGEADMLSRQKAELGIESTELGMDRTRQLMEKGDAPDEIDEDVQYLMNEYSEEELQQFIEDEDAPPGYTMNDVAKALRGGGSNEASQQNEFDFMSTFKDLMKGMPEGSVVTQ